ncbi:MAG: DUF362 domain-containing protein [Myxococcota bacterium]
MASLGLLGWQAFGTASNAEWDRLIDVAVLSIAPVAAAVGSLHSSRRPAQVRFGYHGRVNPTAAKPTVFLWNCPEYDVEAIRTRVRESMDALGLKPRGRALCKPNLVAAGPLFQNAYTRPEVMEGVLLALQDRDGGMTELTVGERCGITIPTRYVFEHSGYDAMLARMKGVKRSLFEEEVQVEIPLTHKGRLRDSIFTPEPVAKADFFVNVPKFKSHPWTTVTFSMKNYIGIQDDRHRLIDHDHRLNEKVADLQYVVQPRLIVVDAVIAGEGRMLTPIPRKMGLIITGNNQPAIDAVCCQIIGVDPATVEHIRLPHQRGFGPIDLAHIDLKGDVSLDEARGRAKGFNVGLVRVEKYFEGTKISAYAGPPPDPELTDYCWGGCPGAIEEAIEILRLFDEQMDAKLERQGRLHVVFGGYEGEIPAQPGDQVVFIGDCTRWRGTLHGESVSVESTYQPRDTKNPHEAKHDDIYAKMASVSAKVAMTRGKTHLKLHGCPVSVAEQVLALSSLTGIKNPILDKTEVVQFNKAYIAWRASMMKRKLTGKPYQRPGAAERGDGKPEV